MAKTVDRILEQAKAWMGAKEGGTVHRSIIDGYNKHRPLAHGYEMKYTDAWCCVFISALSIKLGYTDIIPTDCRCSSFIEKFKKLGVWKEDENRTPNLGDIVFYDWEDNGNGNNKGTPNHVGIVSKVSGNTFEVIEGNKNDAVGVRKMQVNGKYLRGFAVPKYESEPSETPETESVSSYYTYIIRKGDTLTRIARNHGSTVNELAKLNGIRNKNLIRTGATLKIPVRKG